jgi:photosystem II stability/assembly factor-like uncharacterized protein
MTTTRTHRLYVGTIGEGLWRSLDGGDTFTRACDGMFVECHVRALAIDPTNPRRLFLGNEHGLYASADGADTWALVDSPLNGTRVWSILVHPADPQLLFAGGCPSRIIRSEDGGRTWQQPAVTIRQDCPRILHTRVTTLRAAHDSALSVWAGVEIDGLFHSRDRGESWRALGAGLSSQDIHDFASVPRPGEPARLLASTNNDVNASLDGGASWTPLKLPTKLPLPYFRGMAQQCGRPEVVFLGNGDGPPGTTGLIARSTDGGATWQPAEMPGRANSTIWNFAVHAGDPDLIYASSVSGQVYRSTDAGSTWRKLPREFGEIRALAWTD